MALLQYGLPQVSSLCFRVEEVGWMADKKKIKSGPSVECKNQILPVTTCNAQSYYERAMGLSMKHYKCGGNQKYSIDVEGGNLSSKCWWWAYITSIQATAV